MLQIAGKYPGKISTGTEQYITPKLPPAGSIKHLRYASYEM